MGKGNRNSQQRIDNQLANEEKILAKEKAKKNKKNGGRAVAAALIVFVLLIVAVLVLNVLSETGVFLRSTDAMSQDGVVVDAAMMTFFINDQITNWYNNYYIYMMYGMISLDMSKDFKTQKLTSNDAYYMGDAKLTGTTWYDYFVNTVTESVEMYVTYAVAAKKANLTISDEDKAEIDETIKTMKDSLKEYKMSFADQYGKGVTESDVRKCYELIYLASAYGEKMLGEFEAKVESEDDKNSVLTFIDENKGSFYSAKYVSHTIEVSEKELGTQEKFDAAKKDADAAAKKISEAKTPADFVALVEQYEKAPSEFVEEDSTETGTGTETDAKTEKETETKNESATATVEDYEETIYYQTGDELGDWIFGETEPAEKNDTLIVTEEGTEVVTENTTTTKSTEKETESGSEDSGKTTYDTYKVTVYMLVSESDLDRANTHNFAYLISDNKDAAQAFLDEFIASSNKTGDVFEDMAQKHYDKLFEGHDHENHEEGEEDPVFSFAQVDQGKEKYFADNYSKLNDWIDDENRKAGDTTGAKLVEMTVDNSDNTKTTYYAVVLFEGADDPAWYVDGFNGVVQEMIDDWYEGELAKKLIKYNSEAIADIKLIRYSAGTAS